LCICVGIQDKFLCFFFFVSYAQRFLKAVAFAVSGSLRVLHQIQRIWGPISRRARTLEEEEEEEAALKPSEAPASLSSQSDLGKRITGYAKGLSEYEALMGSKPESNTDEQQKAEASASADKPSVDREKQTPRLPASETPHPLLDAETKAAVFAAYDLIALGIQQV
jgi:hypothetical protein